MLIVCELVFVLFIWLVFKFFIFVDLCYRKKLEVIWCLICFVWCIGGVGGVGFDFGEVNSVYLGMLVEKLICEVWV